MNTWILVALIVGALPMAGLLVLAGCTLRAQEGYEDADGFHPGHEPAHSSNLTTLSVHDVSHDSDLAGHAA